MTHHPFPLSFVVPSVFLPLFEKMDVAKYDKCRREGPFPDGRPPRAGAAPRDLHHAMGDPLLHSMPCRACRVGHASGQPVYGTL